MGSQAVDRGAAFGSLQFFRSRPTRAVAQVSVPADSSRLAETWRFHSILFSRKKDLTIPFHWLNYSTNKPRETIVTLLFTSRAFIWLKAQQKRNSERDPYRSLPYRSRQHSLDTTSIRRTRRPPKSIYPPPSILGDARYRTSCQYKERKETRETPKQASVARYIVDGPIQSNPTQPNPTIYEC